MKNQSILAIVCAAALSVSLLTGCGSSKKDAAADNSSSQSNSSQTQETTETDPSDAEVIDDESDAPPADDDVEEESEEDEETTPADDTASTAERAAVNQVNTDEQLSGKHHAQIVIKDHGTIEVELDADTAPISVTNFVKLAEEDFYDGLTFHRIIEGFMMQGGDPKGNGTGGSDETIKGEFASNGVENDLSHKRGVISMARAQAPDSASSQFFIVQQDALYLDGQYAAFGTVTDGMDIVDEICKKAVPIDSNGLIDPAEQPVIETIDIID